MAAKRIIRKKAPRKVRRRKATLDDRIRALELAVEGLTRTVTMARRVDHGAFNRGLREAVRILEMDAIPTIKGRALVEP